MDILAETYEPGEPQDKEASRWPQETGSRDKQNLKTDERYWYGDD